MSIAQKDPTAFAFMTGGGFMAEQIKAYDWSSTPLGEAGSWPIHLKSALAIALNSGFPIAIYWQEDFTLLYNDAWSAIPGKKHPWALGKKGKEVWPEIWALIEAQFNDVLTRGESIRSQDTLLPMNRFGYVEECYFDYTLSPIIDLEGKVHGIFNAVVETSYRVINERRNQLVHALTRKSGTGLLPEEARTAIQNWMESASIDIPFCFIYEQSDGWKLTQSVGMSLAEARKLDWPLHECATEKKTIVIEDLPFVGNKGFVRHWPEPARQALMVPLHRGQQSVKRIMVAVLNPRKAVDATYQRFIESVALQCHTIMLQAGAVSEEKKMLERLEESEAQFRNLVMQSPVAMAIFQGPDLIATIVNDAYLPLVGRTREEFVGKPLFTSLPESREVLEPLAKHLLETGETFSLTEFELVLHRYGQDELCYFNSLWVPWRDANGRIIGMVVVAQEVTEQVNARKRIEENEKDLQRRVEDRTRELEEKNAELEQYAFVSSHDLQEPLRKIRLFTEMIRDREYEKLSPFSQTRFDKIVEAVTRMSTSLKDLLNFTSLQKSEMFTWVDLHEVIDSVKSDLELVIQQKDASIRVGSMPKLFAIPLQMHQLFYNLENNALKFTVDGRKPQISIACKLLEPSAVPEFKGREENLSYYEFIVSDNGIGFDQENAAKIFTIFQRLNDRQQFSGTGIGLALCKKVVLNHQGWIQAFSEPDRGARFHCYLPAKATHE